MKSASNEDDEENDEDDEKEDAALLETMLYDCEKGVELLTPTEQTAFLNELRDLAHSS